MWKFIYSALLIIVGHVAASQQTLPIGLEEDKDFRPSIVKLSADIIPVGESFFGTKSGGHFQGAIDFYNYFFVAEYGFEQIDRGTIETYNYENNGSYWRIGPEVNFLKYDQLGNSLTFGLRFAQSNFNDQIEFQSVGPFGELGITESNPNARATWAEMTAGLNVRVWKGFYMGYTIRFKFLRSVKNTGDFTPYDIPGWGQYRKENVAGFSYFLGWAIPLRKEEKVPEGE